MLAAEEFVNLCLKAINRNTGVWPPSWRAPAGKIGSQWSPANRGAEDLLCADLYVKYKRELANVRDPGGWAWAQVVGELKRLGRLERNGGLTGRKDGLSRSPESWDSREGWNGPRGDGALSMSQGEDSVPAVSLTDWAAWAEWTQDAEETEEESADPARILQRIVLATELLDARGRLKLRRRHPCRSERFKRPWVNPANPGLTDAQLRAMYPQGYAAMLRNPRRLSTEGPVANFDGPVSWPVAQDKKTLFKGMIGTATSTHQTTQRARTEARDYKPKCWLNGQRYRKPRYRYSWQMEAYRTPWLCMLRGFVPRTWRAEFREYLCGLQTGGFPAGGYWWGQARGSGIGEQIRMAAWARVVEADDVRWRGYDFPTSRSE